MTAVKVGGAGVAGAAHLHRDDRDVVPELAARERGDEFLDGAHGLRRGPAHVGGERVGQLVLEELQRRVARFCHPVGVEEQQVAR